ncbi:MAG: AAA family ATPase [Tannerella sp.]|nr:AAA family ATPase [Tannerella sp.]
MLESEENKYRFFIRPRKFGKSLFFSMLSNYYDMNRTSANRNVLHSQLILYFCIIFEKWEKQVSKLIYCNGS